jgi:predicted HicB family RNase H-like nuclease
MTSEVIALAEKKPLRQTTFRIDPNLLRRARFYLDIEGKSVAQFVVEQLEHYVQRHDTGHTHQATEQRA